MKRIIDGRTYNTDTATVVARYEYEDEKGSDVEASIYVNRGGAFFIVHKWSSGEQWKYFFESASRDDILRLMERTNNLELIDEEAINAPPEASEEGEPGATIYVRVPGGLKKRADAAAQEDGVSGNVWAMRCMERCLKLREIDTVKEIGYIFEVAATFRAHMDGEWTLEKALEAHCMIAGWSEDLARHLFGTDDVFASFALTYDPILDEIRREFKPYS